MHSIDAAPAVLLAAGKSCASDVVLMSSFQRQKHEAKMQTNPTPPDIMDRKTAARYLGVAPDTLSVWACTKRYPLKRILIGRSVRYRRCDLDEFLRERLRS